MKLGVDELIPKDAWAYGLNARMIVDAMCLGSNEGGYKNHIVQDLINDGWSFVCATEEFVKGDKCDYKPDKAKYSRTVENTEKDKVDPGCILCPHCNEKITLTVVSAITVKASK